MEIMLDTISAVSKHFELTAEPGELELKLDLAVLASNVDYSVDARRVEDEIFLDGVLGFTVKFTCARCLEEFETSYKFPLNLVLQFVSDERAETHDEESDHFVVIADSKKNYNLDQHLRDLITLEVPMKPICREDCRGLCPKCGTNLNERTCNCTADEIDPRWEKLKNIYKN